MTTIDTTMTVAQLNDICEFGDALIRTGDLDPVYCALHGAQLSEPQLSRLLLAYLLFYHLGLAAWLSEREDESYWQAMLTAAANNTPSPLGGRWPRSSERRHFRARKSVHAVEWLRNNYLMPAAPVRSLLACNTERQVIERVCKWPMCGPWAGFKAADLLERCCGHPLQFDPNIGLLYDAPRAGLDMLATDLNKSPRAIYNDLLSYFSARKAPPSNDRPCGAQEVESILCKMHSMRGGHYFIGKDIQEVRHALQGWGATAAHLFRHMPASPEPRQAGHDGALSRINAQAVEGQTAGG